VVQADIIFANSIIYSLIGSLYLLNSRMTTTNQNLCFKSIH